MKRIGLSSIFLAIVCVMGCGGGNQATNRLMPPEPIASNPSASEVVSIWADGENQTFLIQPKEGWPDEVWGLLAADLLRHAARMSAGSSGKSEAEILATMKKAFDAEWQNPTTDITEGIN